MRAILVSVVSATFLAAALWVSAAGAGETEEKVPLSKVPEVVKAAALKAVPGIVLTGAEKEVENGKVVYELEGTVRGKKYEIEVTPEGKVLEVEEDDDDDDDDADDDDDKADD
ncbi:MAG: PepSY domain-containing protein [Planctomycetota bacterium]|jgi:hypothetical protein